MSSILLFDRIRRAHIARWGRFSYCAAPECRSALVQTGLMIGFSFAALSAERFGVCARALNQLDTLRAQMTTLQAHGTRWLHARYSAVYAVKALIA